MGNLVGLNGEEIKQEVKEESLIKAFVLSSGMNVISEYVEEKSNSGEAGGSEGEEESDLYFIMPMLAEFVRLQNGQVTLGMSPLGNFFREEKLGPINILTILCSYEIDEGLKNFYKDKVLKLRAQKLGLVKATKMPTQNPQAKNPLKIG